MSERDPSTRDRIPAWVAMADACLVRASRDVRLLPLATPREGPTRGEIVAAFERGEPSDPEWTYAAMDGRASSTLRRGLEKLAEEVVRADGALGKAYAARARELALEAEIATRVGARSLGESARSRFSSKAQDTRDASKLALEWSREPAPTGDEETFASCSDDPRSLASRMREEITKRALPFRVVVAKDLAPLAAIGDDTIWVAGERQLSHEDVERTVLHEIEGHAVPRVRARGAKVGLFAIGTARGTDDQEGLALLLEKRGGMLTTSRRRELAWRHRAVEAMDAGGTFVEVVRTLVTRDGVPLARAVAAAERVFRGGGATGAGLGRERVYLPALVKMTAHLESQPDDERVLAAGQVAIDVVKVMAPFAPDSPAT